MEAEPPFAAEPVDEAGRDAEVFGEFTAGEEGGHISPRNFWSLDRVPNWSRVIFPLMRSEAQPRERPTVRAISFKVMWEREQRRMNSRMSPVSSWCVIVS